MKWKCPRCQQWRVETIGRVCQQCAKKDADTTTALAVIAAS